MHFKGHLPPCFSPAPKLCSFSVGVSKSDAYVIVTNAWSLTSYCGFPLQIPTRLISIPLETGSLSGSGLGSPRRMRPLVASTLTVPCPFWSVTEAWVGAVTGLPKSQSYCHPYCGQILLVNEYGLICRPPFWCFTASVLPLAQSLGRELHFTDCIRCSRLLGRESFPFRRKVCPVLPCLSQTWVHMGTGSKSDRFSAAFWRSSAASLLPNSRRDVS